MKDGCYALLKVCGRLPAAYCARYAAGAAWLLPGLGLLRRSECGGAVGGVLRDAAKLYRANQTANIGNVFDRHFQSLILTDRIAVPVYALQLLRDLSSIVGMRETFAVSISESHRHSERVERLISGHLLPWVPLAGTVACFPSEIVIILFQREHFAAAAADHTARVWRILSLTIVTSSVATPVIRVMRTVRRIRLLHVQSPWASAWLRLLVSGPVYVGLLVALYGAFLTRLPFAAR